MYPTLWCAEEQRCKKSSYKWERLEKSLENLLTLPIPITKSETRLTTLGGKEVAVASISVLEAIIDLVGNLQSKLDISTPWCQAPYLRDQ